MKEFDWEEKVCTNCKMLSYYSAKTCSFCGKDFNQANLGMFVNEDD